jgi:hypothetical protein
MKTWRHMSTCQKTKGYKTLRHECERHETWDIRNNDNAMADMGKKTEEENYFGISSQTCLKPWTKIPQHY